MPRRRFLNLPETERTDLLAIARAHFLRRGFDRASLNEILAEAGVSKGSYYYYFDDKEDLFATVVEHDVEELIAMVPLPSFAGVTSARFWPTVERYVAHAVEFWQEARPLLELFVHVGERMRQLPRFAKLLEIARSMWRPVIETGRRLGCVRTDLPTEALLQLAEAADTVIDRQLYRIDPKKMSKAMFERHTALAFDTFRRLMEAPRRRRRG